MESTHFAENPMMSFNAWANRSEMKENDKDLKTALSMIRVLVGYSFRFCDAEGVATEIEALAQKRLEEEKNGE